MRTSIPAILLMVMISSVQGAGPYYVDPVAGSNSDDGLSEGNAWATIAYAEQNAANGSTVYLMTGSHGDISLTDATNGRASMDDALTFTPNSGDTPTITQLTINAAANLYLIFDGLTIQSASDDRAATCQITAGSYITITGCTIVGYQGWDASNSRYDQGLSTTLGIAVGIAGNAIGNITIEDTDLSNCGSNAIDIQGTRTGPVTISNCVVHDFGGSGLRLGGPASSSATVFQDNKVYGMEHVWYAASGEYNHGSGISVRSYPLTVRRNIVHDCGDSAPYTQYRSVFAMTGYQDTTIENNLFYDSSAASLTCVFYDIGNNWEFVNNTVVGFYTGATKSYRYGNAIYLDYCTSYTASTIIMANNIILGYMAVPAAGTIFTNNHVWAAMSGTNWFDQTEMDAAFPNNTVYAWQQLPEPANFAPATNTFGWLGGGAWATYTYAKNHHQDITTGYQLDPNSVAVDAANATYAPEDDLDGDTRDASPDIGCFEVGGATSSPPTAATSPSPANAATGVREDTDLSWTSGANGPLHHVYFGTSESDVTNGTGGTDKGTRSGTLYDPGKLAFNTTYYWRVAEENGDGTDAGTTWSFTTRPRPKKYRLIRGFR